MSRTSAPDPLKRRRIEEQSDALAQLLDVNAEEIMVDLKYGVMLTPEQTDRLMAVKTPLTVGAKFGQGTVIAAMQHAHDSGKVAVVTRIQKRLVTEYGVGVVSVDADGVPAVGEWDFGTYKRSLPLALVLMAERAKQVPAGDLGLTPQGETRE